MVFFIPLIQSIMKGDGAEEKAEIVTAEDYTQGLLKVCAEFWQTGESVLNMLLRNTAREVKAAAAVRTKTEKERKGTVHEVKTTAEEIKPATRKKRTTINEPEFLQTGNIHGESKIELTVKNEKTGQSMPLRKREDAVLVKSVEDRFEEAFENYLRTAGGETGLDYYPRSIMPEVVNFKDRRAIWGRMDYFNEQEICMASDKECNLVVIPPGHPQLNSKYGLPEFKTLQGQVSLLIRPQIISREWAAVNLAYFLPVMYGYDQERSRSNAGCGTLSPGEEMRLMSVASVEQIALLQRITNGKFLENVEAVYRRWDRSKMTKLMLFGDGSTKKIARRMHTEMGLPGFLNEPVNMVERALQTQVAMSSINIITAAKDAKKYGFPFLDRLTKIFMDAE